MVRLQDPDQLRQRIREQAKESLFFLCKAVLGFHDLTVDLHLPICNLVQDRNVRRLLLVIPRGHFKTSIGSIGYPIWLLLNNPNERIMLVSSTATNAERFLSRIKAAFETNEMFRWAFPELIPDLSARTVIWNQSAVVVKRSRQYPDPSIDTVGVGGKVAGRHCTVKIGDDIVGEQDAESIDQLQKILQWHELSESLFENPETDVDRQICTRWHHTDDVAGYILAKDRRYKAIVRSAIEDGKVLFPQRFSMEMYEDMRKRKPKIFAMQYMNQPMSEDDLDFRMEWLKYYQPTTEGKLKVDGEGDIVDPNTLTKYLRLDPALSTDPEACRSAFVVDGVDKKDRIFLLEVIAKRLDPPGIINLMLDLIVKWRPTAVAMEEVVFQRVFKYWLIKEAARRGINVPIRPLKTSTQKSKEQRIRGVSHFFAGGMVYISSGMTNFIEEYSTFPLGHSVDILDAFAYGPQMWRKPDKEVKGPMPILPQHLDPSSKAYWENYHRDKLGLEKEDPLDVVGTAGPEEGLSELFA